MLLTNCLVTSSAAAAAPPSLACQPVPCAATSTAPLPSKDFASCATGGASFAVVGGYDGRHEHMHVYTCSIQPAAHAGGANDGTSAAAGAAAGAPADGGAAARGAVGDSSSGSGTGGWQAVWQRHWPPGPLASGPAAEGEFDAAAARSACGAEPLGRVHHSVSYDHTFGALYVFGGYATGTGYLGDLWRFDCQRRGWSQLTCGKAPSPGARRGHAAALLDGRLYVIGGAGPDGRHFADVWCFDTGSCKWQQLEAGGAAPGPRRGAALAALGAGATRFLG